MSRRSADRGPRPQVPAAEAIERDGGYFHQDRPVDRQYGKMGKSPKNSVSPDEIFSEYGADTLRVSIA